MSKSVKANTITFQDSDFNKKALTILAEKIAENVRKSIGRITKLNEFLKKSGNWVVGNHKASLERWKSFVLGRRPKKAAADVVEFVDLIESIFSVCTCQDDWLKMRGLIPEKLFEPYFQSKNSGKLVGFGVNVLINGNKVHYKPNTADSRQTVDAGSWDENFGEFVEIKFQPTAFQEKDIGYLTLLESQLDNNNIPHKIKLLTFDDVSTTRKLLIAENLIADNTRFEILSHESFLAI
ncbi:hypothetical protein [Lysinibacillus sphaericus]|uniref:hypothetical protein n=1 Tax=Lysinibacillus sphaericus TaxID=1421 RepID=UPI003D7F280B